MYLLSTKKLTDERLSWPKWIFQFAGVSSQCEVHTIFERRLLKKKANEGIHASLGSFIGNGEVHALSSLNNPQLKMSKCSRNAEISFFE